MAYIASNILVVTITQRVPVRVEMPRNSGERNLAFAVLDLREKRQFNSRNIDRKLLTILVGEIKMLYSDSVTDD